MAEALLPGDLEALNVVLFGSPAGPDALTVDDVQRWYKQGFCLQRVEPFEAPAFLSQNSGGPCGVICAVQSLILGGLCFTPDFSVLAASTDAEGPLPAPGAGPPGLTDASEEACKNSLTASLAYLIWQAATAPSSAQPSGRPPPSTAHLVVLGEGGAVPTPTAPAPLCRSEAGSLEDLHALLMSSMASYESDCGVLLLMYSIILSRGVLRVKADKDSGVGEATGLLGRFGWCTQELLNLVLTGAATSNAFDGVKTLGGEAVPAAAESASAAAGGGGGGGGGGGEGGADDSCVMYGVAWRPLVGYLSLHETHKLIEVGEYFKTPKLPLWVVAGEGHFTCLWGADMEPLRPMPLQRLQAAFKRLGNAEGGMLEVAHLPKLLTEAGLGEAHASGEGLAAFKKSLEDEQGLVEGYILWGALSRVAKGVLHRGGGGAAHTGNGGG
jgi:hypothetical protein